MHEAYIRIIPESRTAVLFVHGIIGTPDHFSELISLLPDDVSVVNVLLDGHGGSVKDFADSSMKKWEAQIENVLSELEKNHEHILAAGHSMGTLLLMDALRNHKKVRAMFFLGSALKMGPKPLAARNSLKVIYGKSENWDPLVISTHKSCSIKLEKNLFKYLSWIPRYLELFRKAARVRGNIGEIGIPCIFLQSEKDELVSKRSCKFIRSNAKMKLIELPESYHFHYSDKDKRTVKQSFIDWYTENTKANPSK